MESFKHPKKYREVRYWMVYDVEKSGFGGEERGRRGRRLGCRYERRGEAR
jgi:hypothetical protein